MRDRAVTVKSDQMKDLISRHFGGAINPAKAPLQAGAGMVAILLWAAYYFSGQEALRRYCPLLVSVAIGIGLLGQLWSFKLQRDDHQLRLKLVKILEEQSRKKNLKQVCLEKAFAEIYRPLPPT